MKYVDGFVTAVAEADREKYLAFESRACRILKELAAQAWSVASDMDVDGDRGQASGDSERSGNVLLIHVVPN